MNLSSHRGVSPVLRDLTEAQIEFLESAATERWAEAKTVLFRADETANRFYLVLEGTVGLEVAGPSRPAATVHTVGAGSLLGLSWRFPPYQWQWTAVVSQPARLAEFDANAVLSACETDSDLDNALLRVVAKATAQRLQNVRLQLLDLYGGRKE